MADISKEINDFRSARYGREVRESMISLAEKLNREVETNTSNVAGAVENTNRAASAADEAAGKGLVAADAANTAANTALSAAQNANDAADNLAERVAAGEFKGEKGDKGDPGPQGESGVMAPSSGLFSLSLDTATGNLYADYPDGEAPPAFQYDAATGNLYYLTGEDAQNG